MNQTGTGVVGGFLDFSTILEFLALDAVACPGNRIEAG
jgi:hypothetical protein